MRLRDYLKLGANEATITGVRRALGYQQILTATLAASTGLTLPTVTSGSVPGQSVTQIPPGLAIVQCTGGVVRWRDDGTAPTSTVGMILADGAELDYTGDIANLRFIASSGSPILECSLYGGLA